MSKKYTIPEEWKFAYRTLGGECTAEQLRNLYYFNVEGIEGWAQTQTDMFAETVIADMWKYYTSNWIPEFAVVSKLILRTKGATEEKLRTRSLARMLSAATYALENTSQYSERDLRTMMRVAYADVYDEIRREVEQTYITMVKIKESWWSPFFIKYSTFILWYSLHTVGFHAINELLTLAASKIISKIMSGQTLEQLSAGKQLLVRSIQRFDWITSKMAWILKAPFKALWFSVKRTLTRTPAANIRDIAAFIRKAVPKAIASRPMVWLRQFRYKEIYEAAVAAPAAMATGTFALTLAALGVVSFGLGALTAYLIITKVPGIKDLPMWERNREPELPTDLSDDLRIMIESASMRIANSSIDTLERIVEGYNGIKNNSDALLKDNDEAAEEWIRSQLERHLSNMQSLKQRVGNIVAKDAWEQETVNWLKSFMNLTIDDAVSMANAALAGVQRTSAAGEVTPEEILPYIDELRVMQILMPGIEAQFPEATKEDIDALTDAQRQDALSRAIELQREELEDYAFELTTQLITDKYVTYEEIGSVEFDQDIIDATIAAEALSNMVSSEADIDLMEFDAQLSILQETVAEDPETQALIEEMIIQLTGFRAVITEDDKSYTIGGVDTDAQYVQPYFELNIPPIENEE